MVGDIPIFDKIVSVWNILLKELICPDFNWINVYFDQILLKANAQNSIFNIGFELFWKFH